MHDSSVAHALVLLDAHGPEGTGLSHVEPKWVAGQLHANPAVSLWHVPPFLHGDDVQKLTTSSQVGPWKFGAHVHAGTGEKSHSASCAPVQGRSRLMPCGHRVHLPHSAFAEAPPARRTNSTPATHVPSGAHCVLFTPLQLPATA